MKSSARSLSALTKQGSHGTERAKAIPGTTFGMKTSRSTNSLSFESRLSKLKRASSDDMLTKPGGSTAITSSRLKKTVTTGAISELTESRFRSTSGAVSAARRTGIPAPRELSTQISRDRAVLRGPANTKKILPSPSSPSTATPTKHLRAPSRPKQENETSNKTVLESQVKELLAEAKTKDFEIGKLRSELKKCKDKDSLSPDVLNSLEHSVDIPLMPCSDPAALIRTLQEKNMTFQHELVRLGKENRDLKQKLCSLAQSPLSETATSNGSDSSVLSPSTQGPSIGSQLKSPLTGESEVCRLPGDESGLHISGSSSIRVEGSACYFPQPFVLQVVEPLPAVHVAESQVTVCL
ncbi:cytospin-B-like [Ascaphus truei]|uniref:cytospin-B-like n=1 Tax=Ascaphus truei TaxID=8439 RepID=UPI003F59ADE5